MPKANADPSCLATPSPAQAAWQELELGLLIGTDINHFDLGVKPEGIPFGEAYPPAIFNPKRLDMDQWFEVCSNFGARYTIYPAKGGTGFLQWQTDVYDYGMKAAIAFRDGKGDMVREYTEASARHGLKTGFYCCLHWNSYLGVIHRGEGKVGIVGGGQG